MEALEEEISALLGKYESEESGILSDLKSVLKGCEKAKDIYQKCRKDRLNKGNLPHYLVIPVRSLFLAVSFD